MLDEKGDYVTESVCLSVCCMGYWRSHEQMNFFRG